jgi:hypothetical protein
MFWNLNTVGKKVAAAGGDFEYNEYHHHWWRQVVTPSYPSFHHADPSCLPGTSGCVLAARLSEAPICEYYYSNQAAGLLSLHFLIYVHTNIPTK